MRLKVVGKMVLACPPVGVLSGEFAAATGLVLEVLVAPLK